MVDRALSHIFIKISISKTMQSPDPRSQPPEASSAKARLQEAAKLILSAFHAPNDKSKADIASEADKRIGRWLDRYFMRHGVPEAQAEELTMEVWIKLLKGKYETRDNAFALICGAARSVLIDHIRLRHTAKNSAGGMKDAGSAEVSVDEELWDLTAQATPGMYADLELRDCIQKKMHQFASTHPGRAQLIEYVAEGLSYLEIATLIFGEAVKAGGQAAKKETDKMINRVRNRIEEARKQARVLFQECQD